MSYEVRLSAKDYWKRFTRLFFVKRRPKPHTPMYWTPPQAAPNQRYQDTEEYQQLLSREGFISPKHWTRRDLKKYPKIMQDLTDLEQHLLPVFWEFNQKSLHYQNRYYLYQWIFMLGTFITTILGVFTTYAFTLPDFTMNLAILDIGGDKSPWVTIFGALTALIGAITTYFSFMSTNGNPQVRWAKTRRLAEELRTLYYQFLSHNDPYHDENRVQKMRETVLEIIRKERENV